MVACLLNLLDANMNVIGLQQTIALFCCMVEHNKEYLLLKALHFQIIMHSAFRVVGATWTWFRDGSELAQDET